MSTAPSIDEALRDLRGEGGDTVHKVVPVVKHYLQETRVYLAELHRITGSGRIVNETNSDLTDRLVRGRILGSFCDCRRLPYLEPRPRAHRRAANRRVHELGAGRSADRSRRLAR